MEHNAENLQFFLWYKDYCRRWELLPATEQSLSTAWTHAETEAPNLSKNPEAKLKRKQSTVVSKIFSDSNWDQMLDSMECTKDAQSFVSSSVGGSSIPTVTEAQANVGLGWKACKSDLCIKQHSSLTSL